ncbi:glycosyltransferase family 4 protein [Candidatus Accumulibacter regalis]|uniref:Glycosyl transferase group 1 n=1 Tax=Accumulibacter regalis TaxID=522306 RepID=C7RIE2_ACCRE
MLEGHEVLLIQCTQASKSGAAKYVSELFGAIRSSYPDAVLVCPEDFEYLGTFPKDKLRVFCSLRARRRFGKLLEMGKQFLQCSAIILDLKHAAKSAHTLVHFNFPGIPFLSLLQMWQLSRRHVRLVLTVHDVYPHRWLLPVWLRIIEIKILTALYQAPDALVVHHSSQKETLIRDFGVPADSVTVTSHGVFSLCDRPLPYTRSEEFRVLCFGAIRKNKGIHLAIEAVQRLRAEGLPVTLVIAGAVSQGERLYWGECEALVARAPQGIDVVARFIGEEEVRGLFECSHLVVLPYTDFYSQSGVATMALSSGRPIASTTAGGLGELLGDGKFGFEIGEPTVGALMRAIREATDVGHDRLQAMGAEAFMTLQRDYSWREAAKTQAKLYAAVVDGSAIGSTCTS